MKLTYLLPVSVVSILKFFHWIKETPKINITGFINQNLKHIEKRSKAKWFCDERYRQSKNICRVLFGKKVEVCSQIFDYLEKYGYLSL